LARNSEMMESAKRFSFRHLRSAASAMRRAEGRAINSRKSLSRLHVGPPNRMVMKAQVSHRFGIQQVSTVKDNWRPHFFLHHSQIDIGKFIPFGGEDERFGIIYRVESGRSKFGGGDRFFGSGPFPFFLII